MSDWRERGAAVLAIFQRDLQVFLSYRLRAVSRLSSVLVSIATFHFIAQLVNVEPFGSSDEYFAFVVTGLLATFILHSALLVPMTIRETLMTGNFERLLVSPFGVFGAIVAAFLFPLMFGTVTAVFGFLASVVLFSFPIQWATAPLAIPVALLGAVAFGSLGLLLAACIVAFKQAPGINVILALISLTAGVYFPVELLPGWLSWISEVQPFTPSIDLLRHLLIGSDAAEPAGTALLKLVLFSLVLVPLGMVALRAAIATGKRRGTILEY